MNEQRFKQLLEYFVTHLMFKQNNGSTQVQGYDVYLAPLIAQNKFCHTGNGYNGDRIQQLINGLDMYNKMQICINVQGNYGDYTAKKCYLNWLGTGINVYARWDKNKKQISSLYIGYYFWWEGTFGDDIILEYPINNLGLDLYSTTPPNQNLKDFYNKFIQLYKDYKNNQGIYYLAENTYHMKKYIDLLTANKNIILTGAPGTGKTFLAQRIAEAMGATGQQYGFVQFHPSYDYTDFVEGLRPVNTSNNTGVGFVRQDGSFMEFCRKALANQNENFVFIIDEINRGEISKIFGELFFSIDPDYRGIKGSVTTQYANLWGAQDKFGNTYKFYVPENVYVIGTMNDIDRSVESMDFAMRRRFAFIEILAEDRVSMIQQNNRLASLYADIHQRMMNLNLCILTITGLSTAYQIGASYFLKLENYLDSNNKLSKDSWDSLWNNHIYGVLFEYLRGLPNAKADLEKLRRAYDLKIKYEQDSASGEVKVKDNNG